MRAPRRRQEGFTLIELLVVVAIIGLLAALAVPKLYFAINKARATPGLADMLIISTALDRYYIDYYTYPNGDDADQVIANLRGAYLKPTTTYQNGYKQGYLYLIRQDARGYMLIDLQGEQQDDHPDPGQQIIILCSDGDPANDVERVFDVQTGSSATLTLPTVPVFGDPWQVEDWMWDYCDLKNPNPNIKLTTN